MYIYIRALQTTVVVTDRYATLEHFLRLLYRDRLGDTGVFSRRRDILANETSGSRCWQLFRCITRVSTAVGNGIDTQGRGAAHSRSMEEHRSQKHVHLAPGCGYVCVRDRAPPEATAHPSVLWPVPPFLCCSWICSVHVLFLVQEKLMKRTLADGSFVKLLTADNLHPDLGSGDAMDMERSRAKNIGRPDDISADHLLVAKWPCGPVKP